MLASIQEVVEVAPIPDAQHIERVRVLGWDIVAKKGEFVPGSLCIYVEIDTLLPRTEWSEFLFKDSEDTQYRLRTIRLRKQISQGLVLPLFPTLPDDDAYAVGDDVSDILGVKHYEKPMPNINPRSGMRAKGNFPMFIRKTDEVRIQSAPELLDQLRGKPYYITQKLDGTSGTFFKHNGQFGTCSRNLELKDPTKNFNAWFDVVKDKLKAFLGLRKSRSATNPRTFAMDIYWKMAYKYRIMDWLPEGWAIQGEICGPSIQGNKMGLEDHQLFIFNVWNIVEQKYYNPMDWDAINGYGLDLVPLLYWGKSFGERYDDGGTIEELLKESDGEYDNRTPQEGIVVRATDQTISFKVVNNVFLLKYKE